MAEIKINLANLENAISRLEVLGRNWAANDVKPPVTVGGGKTVNELEALATMYQKMNEQMVTLAENTRAFLTGIKESYQESDHKAADKIVHC